MVTNRNHPYYRRLYRKIHGEIPIDEDGRSFDIHHMDGNKENNSPENLVALSIKDHYQIHYDQGDWGSCWSISLRMSISPEEKSEISRRIALKRVEDGTNPFLDGERARRVQLEKVKDGTHHFLNTGKGENHPCYDTTVYRWRNKKTGEILELTPYQFRMMSNAKSGRVSNIIHGIRKSTRGWELVNDSNQEENL
jgi:hypothetical protein